jgi:hypothetical protein
MGSTGRIESAVLGSQLWGTLMGSGALKRAVSVGLGSRFWFPVTRMGSDAG